MSLRVLEAIQVWILLAFPLLYLIREDLKLLYISDESR